MFAWLCLALAGVFETGWAVGLKLSEGFTRPIPVALTVVSMAASMWLLSLACRTIPVGTAYAVWVGIGVLGTVIVGATAFHEPLSAPRLAFVALLIVALVGLQLTAPESG